MNNRTQKIINIALIISFLVCYMQWGRGRGEFIFQVEYDLLFRAEKSMDTLLHPFVLLPFCGQLILLFTLFQKRPGHWLSTLGLALMATLVLMLVFVGFVVGDIKIILSTLPFIAAATFHFRNMIKRIRAVEQ